MFNQNFKIMKKFNFILSTLVAVLFIGLAGASESEEVIIGGKDDNTEIGGNDEENIVTDSELENLYFSVENAICHKGNIPSATTPKRIEGLSCNRQALAGGMNFITIVTDVKYSKFFLAVKGVDCYWIYTPEQNAETRATDDGITTYSIPVMYSTDYNSDITMLISGEDEDGDITEPYEIEINYVSSMSGDLNINLTFSNAKDVDLHLYMPNGEHIYYGNRGGSAMLSDGSIVTYGLDKDSNAGCNIDNLNNENIYIPAALIQFGTYTVVVDMFSNCNPSIATSWSIVTRYKDNIIENLIGSNPVSGVYPAGARNGDMTKVMTFTINEANTRSATISSVVPGSFKPIPLTDMDELKMEEAKYIKSLK